MVTLRKALETHTKFLEIIEEDSELKKVFLAATTKKPITIFVSPEQALIHSRLYAPTISLTDICKRLIFVGNRGKKKRINDIINDGGKTSNENGYSVIRSADNRIMVGSAFIVNEVGIDVENGLIYDLDKLP